VPGGIHDLQSKINHSTRARRRSGGTGVGGLGMSKSRAKHRAGQRNDVRWLVGGIAGLESWEEDGGMIFKIELQQEGRKKPDIAYLPLFYGDFLSVCVSCSSIQILKNSGHLFTFI
jgi:hypothetical protein